MTPISLQPELVLSIFGWQITNSLLTTVSVSVLGMLLAGIFYIFRNHNENKSIFLKLWHIVVYELLYLIDRITGDRTLSKRLLPLIATLFIFIAGTNLIALLPGFLGSFYLTTTNGTVPLFRSPSSDLTTTTALALITVCAIQYFSITTLGVQEYVRRFVDVSGFLPFVLGLFELLSECTRVLSFSFRLFGNVFAGEVLLIVIAFLVPVLAPVPFMVLEIFVSLIQAYIFCVLALTYVRLSVTREHRSESIAVT